MAKSQRFGRFERIPTFVGVGFVLLLATTARAQEPEAATRAELLAQMREQKAKALQQRNMTALKKADFASLRGGFKFNNNGYPIQNFYLTKVAKRPDGKFQTEIAEKVFENYGDRYAKDCAPGK